MAGAVTETLVTRSEQETVAAGRALGERLTGGAIVLLDGDLGAGKTAFVRGLAAALGIDESEVSSPTFTLVQEYRGRLMLYHADLYRLSAAEAADLGLEEIAGPSSQLAVEWAERLARPPEEAISVSIVMEADDSRRITIRSGPGRHSIR
jgi:tRNA threonylcarbamoyladenosine biosynthesis protein TsaE